MKKVIASAGLVALGAASLQAAYAPGLSSQEASKPWNVSLAVRGFYDDNYNTADSPADRGSFGIEFRPSVNVNLPMDQTLLTFGYTYSLKWYEGRTGNGESSTDQAHLANFGLDHAFSQKCRVTVTDAFSYTSEPDLATGGVPVRSDRNNVYNQAAVRLHAEFTDQFGIMLGYQNTLVDYSQDGANSYSAMLDRLEHLITLDLRWQAFSQTVLVFGYQYGIVGYTDNEAIGGGFVSDDRNYTSHYLYVGADHTFNPNLTASIRGGVQIMDFDNSNVGDTSTSPYVDASLNYIYMPGSSATIGIRHSYTSTDVGFDPSGTSANIAGGAQALMGYLNILHHFTPDLSANLMGSLQQNTFDGGGFDGNNETVATVGIALAYQFNQYLAAETGYNFDSVSSDLGGRDYTRNRVFIGLKASY